MLKWANYVTLMFQSTVPWAKKKDKIGSYFIRYNSNCWLTYWGRKSYSCFFGILFMISAHLSGSPDTLSLPHKYYFGLEQGLPHRIIFGSAYNNDSLLWIATEGGLCLFDGYKMNRMAQFPVGFLGKMRLDEDGRVFSVLNSFTDSLEVFDPATNRAFGHRLTKQANGTFGGTTFSHKDSRLYFAAGGQVYRYDPEGAPEPVHQLPAETEEGDQLLYADQDLYLFYRARDNELRGSDNIRIPLPSQSKPELFYYDRSGRCWLSTSEGLFNWQAGASSFSSAPKLSSGKVINFVAEDEQGHLLFGHERLLFRKIEELVLLNRDSFTDLSWVLKHDDRIYSISGKDFREEMRLNTWGGLQVLRKAKKSRPLFQNFLESELLPGQFGHVMRGFTADDAGNVYTNKDSRSPWWFKVDKETLALDTLVMKDNRGNIANQFGCGTELINYQGDIYGMSCFRGITDTGHIYRYRPSTDEWKRWPLPKTNQIPRWIIPGRTDQELLIFTEESKEHLKGEILCFYPAKDSIAQLNPSGPEVHLKGMTKKVAKDTSRQVFWIGTTMGLYRFNYLTERLHHFVLPDGKATIISDIYLQSDGGLILGTLRSGLQMFTPSTGTFEQVGGKIEAGSPPPNPLKFLPLPSNDISAIRLTPDHHLLISTFNGLVLHYGKNSSVFTTSHGLPDNEFNTPSLFYNAKNDRWFAGGINGFTSFRTADLLPNECTTKPLLLRYTTLGKNDDQEKVAPFDKEALERLVIEPSIAYFSVDFTLPGFFKPGENQYITKLEGHDRDWRPATTDPFVQFTNLPPGHYRLKLRGVDEEGCISAEATELAIWVKKHWLQRTWFRMLCALVLGLIIVFWHNARMKRLRKDYEATRRVQELELRTLRQQLNPHFLSNAMNAIRDYIRKKEPEKAASYLTDFNRLMRLFLESSRNRYTSIDNEMEMLRKYVSLEQLRFPGKFTASFDLDPAINPGMDEIPSLLLQPIVENAINHGLFPLKNGGELHIKVALVSKEEEELVITISDNGVGRKIAGERAKGRVGHTSRANEILLNRLSLLEEDPSIDLDITVEDLYPEQEHTGTKVTIRIS